MEAGNRALPPPQRQTPFFTSRGTEKHKTEVLKSRSSNFSWHSTAAAWIGQATNVHDLALVQPIPAKERKAEDTEQAERAETLIKDATKTPCF